MKKQQVHTYKQQISGYQKESGWREKWVKRFNYMVTDGIQTFDSENAKVYTDIKL